MLRKKISTFVLICLAIMALTAVNSEGDISIPKVFDYKFELKGKPDASGAAELLFTFYPVKKFHYNDAKTAITIIPKSGLKVLGDTAWTVYASEDKPYSTILNVVLVPNDTSGLRIELLCGTLLCPFERHFVFHDDSIAMFHADPRHIIPPFPTQPRKGPRVGWWLPGEFPELDSLYGPPIPPFEIGHKYETYMLSKEEITRSKMRKLERKPLSGIGAQVFFIDDKVWMRKRGETKFYETEAKTSGYTRLQADSIAGIPDNTEKEVCLIISTQEQLEQAEKLLGTLEPTGEKGYYHQIVRWGDLKKLDSVGIKIIFLENAPHEHPRKQDSVTPKSTESGAIDDNRSLEQFW